MTHQKRTLAKPSKLSKDQWNRLAERDLTILIARASEYPGLRKLARSSGEWRVDVKMLGAAAMAQLNRKFRGKDYATDVLSFPSPLPFRRAGHLGELVICLPVLKRQAKNLGHSERTELRVLLVHGILHLLGLDHERGREDETKMQLWESRLLGNRVGKASPGLIGRSQ